MEPEERIAELEDRIEQLELEHKSETDMTRRDTLKSGAAALGLGGLIGGGAGAAATGTASAGTDQTGTWGSPNNPQDWYVEDVYDGAGNMVASAENGALTGTELQYAAANIDDLSVTNNFSTAGLNVSSDGGFETNVFTHENINGSVVESRSVQSISGDNTSNVLSNADRGGFYIVIGNRGDGTSFIDLLISLRSAGVNTVQSIERNTPGTRTYSHIATRSVTIAIDDAGETYNIAVSSLTGDV